MTYWFKRHPQLFLAESTALTKNPYYKELFQVRDNLFISHGYILVRLEKTHRFPILIVYPDATPFVLPAIYPLTQELSTEVIDCLAKGKANEVYAAIVPWIHYYYHLRHQNKSGVLCILEWDNLDDGSKFYGIATILKRVRDWFKGTITGEFPPDSQEVAFHAHFVNVAEDLKLLYPDKFLNERFVDGEAYSTLLSHFPKDTLFKQERNAYFGCLLIGKSKSGLIEHVEYDLPNFFFEEGIKSPIDLIEKKDLIARLIKENKLSRSVWFQLNAEPNPFKSFPKLIELIGEGNYDTGVKRMSFYLAEERREKPDCIFISIRFPNRKGQQEFQLFRVLKKSEPSGVLIGLPPEEAFKHFLSSYDIVETVRSELFTDESYHMRNAGRADRTILENKTVNVVGVGALGSEIADCISKAGIGNLSLFDNQLVEGPNPVRHLAGLNQMDLPKVMAVRQVITNHNPFIKVQLNGDDVNTIDINDCFKDGSVSISSMADDNTEAFLNERAVISHKVVFYARALRGGKAARIFRVIPGKDACFHCLGLYRNEQKEITIIPEDETLPTLTNECNNPVRPASAADLKLIAALTSRILLDELQKGFGESNHWIWSSEKLEGLQPFQLQPQTIPLHPECYYCNHKEKVEVLLPTDVLKQMQELVAENPQLETGGVLAGYVNEEGNIIISNASGPGPKATKSATKFKKDIEYCQTFLDGLFVSSDKKIVYIGEWHSHPSQCNKPSGIDINSLTQIAYQKEYLTDMPVMIILSNTGAPSCTVHPAGKSYYFSNLIVTP
jgi:integrative and conjugative element protein (TIGR02256 family)